MKKLVCNILLVATVCSTYAYAQKDQQKVLLEAVVKRSIMTQPTVLWAKRLIEMETLGDSIAVPIEEILKEKKSLTSAQEKIAIGLIRVAFLHPERIKDSADKKPTRTLSLLGSLGAVAPNEEMMDQINAVKQFVTNQTK